ncbi:MAG: nucleotide-binding protein [Hydrogenophilales bacterium]|nr:nucleotide-binding protein [Hydrogenophilales bacterium]
MKILLAVGLLVAATAVQSAPSPAAASVVKGLVLEVQDVESYTYLRLKTQNGETWAAVNRAPVVKGAQVSIDNAMVMTNFESKTLKKTFPSIVFGTLGAATGKAGAASGTSTWTTIGSSQTKASPAIKVVKASGTNAHTVEEIVTNAAKLKDKTVSVRGQVVKYNAGIMGKNWVHLRDGTGSANAGSDDILVTTRNETKTGSTVTAQGTVRTNKDFGAGYAFAVMIEDAALR